MPRQGSKSQLWNHRDKSLGEKGHGYEKIGVSGRQQHKSTVFCKQGHAGEAPLSKPGDRKSCLPANRGKKGPGGGMEEVGKKKKKSLSSADKREGVTARPVVRGGVGGMISALGGAEGQGKNGFVFWWEGGVKGRPTKMLGFSGT